MRRSRRLVVSFIATFANYEYGFYWYLYQDGTIEHEVKLTGIMITGCLPPGETPTYGSLGHAAALRAQPPALLQPTACDMDVDGPGTPSTR